MTSGIDARSFVTRYNAFTVKGNKKCYNYAGGREYCGPGDYPSLSSKLYHNDGHGHFVDVTQKSGIWKFDWERARSCLPPMQRGWLGGYLRCE